MENGQMKKQAQPRFHYAWIILVSCCLMQSAIVGVVQNGRGIFYNPVCTELGFETSAFTLYSLFHGIGSFLFMPLMTKLFNRVHPRLSLGFAVTLFCGTTALMGSSSSLPLFYVLGFLQGAGGALLVFFICPLLISNWFKSRYGFAMGLYAAFSGLAGVIVNPLLNAVIESAGWRTGYRVQGLLAFALALPAALLVRSRAPEEVGLTRLGEDGACREVPAAEKSSQDTPASTAEKQILLWVMIFAVVSAVVNAYCQHIAKYAATIGLLPSVGALLVSFSMAGNIASKFVVGALDDKIGTKKALVTASLMVIAGFAGMVLTAPGVLLYPSSFFSGVCMPLCSLCTPMLAKHLYGPVRYRKFFPRVSMVTSLASSAGITILSLLYEIWYSYVPVFLLGIALVAVCLVCLFAAERIKTKDS